MNSSRIALMPLICILVLGLAAGVVDLSSTGTNIATGVATVQGDIFTDSDAGSLYSGAWAHVWVPTGNDGVNSGVSERTVQARTEDRPAGTVNAYSLTTGYGDSAVIAKATKSGVLGSAEAFSEVSARSLASDTADSNKGEVSGCAQLTAYISHSGTGTANASANGSSEYEALMDNGIVVAAGSVDGSVALDAVNSYGGSVTGAAFKASQSKARSSGSYPDLYPSAASESFEYLSIESGRDSLSAESTIDGQVSGDASGSGFAALTGAPDRYASSESSTKGDLSASAATYKLGDSITPGEITTAPRVTDFKTQLDDQIASGQTGIKVPLYTLFLGGASKASSYQLSQSESAYVSDASTHKSTANSESFTSAGVARTLTDATEAYGASYINKGTLSAAAYTSSAAGMSPITLASAGVNSISMGSGAHLVSRLTGALPASAADLTITSSMNAAGTGSVKVTGDAHKAPPGVANTLVTVVGPSYSPSGTDADATGSYLTAAKISGTAVHVKDDTFAAASKQSSKSISKADIRSWLSGDDPRSHSESSAGPSPIFSSGPDTSTSATATSRSIDVIFG
ncbi:MAG TPA: hypothetical protein VN455_09355 [Methanotrichaceae archaeon]|nr:hypothetical protein [Methanotrichaceae archaeon]